MPTNSALVHSGYWDDETRAHPAMKFMEEYTISFVDARNWDGSISEWYTKDYLVVHSNGQVVEGQAGVDSVKEIYQRFAKNFHEPYFLICSETEYGWEMIGQAKLYVNHQGQPVQGESKVKDKQGREWDAAVPGAFRFEYTKESGAAHGGVLLRRSELHVDSLPFFDTMVKRGLVKIG